MKSANLRTSKALTIVPNNTGGLTAVNTTNGRAIPANGLVYSILETFSRPSTIELGLIVIAGGDKDTEEDARNIIESMIDTGILVQENARDLSSHDRNYFGAYQQLRYQREMLMDTARTRAFEAAINEVVGESDTVIDAGSGSGILSLLAARAGAKKVHAIERSNIVHIAKAVSEKNNFGNVIEFAQCMAEEFTCNEKASVLVSELLGDFVLRELSFKSTCSVRDRCCSPDVKCIPSRVRMFIAPVEDAELWLHDGPGYWQSPVYGFDFTPALEAEYSRLGSKRAAVSEHSLLDDRVQVHDIDYEKTPVDEFYFSSDAEFTLQRDGSLHGFAGSFDMQLSPSVWLDTGSESKETHWQQVFFPLTSPLPVRKGDTLKIEIRVQDPENPQKRNPDTLISGQIIRNGSSISEFSNWYDKSRHGAF